MRKRKYYLYLTAEERRYIFNALLAYRNKLIAQGRYTDAVDEVIIKFAKRTYGGRENPCRRFLSKNLQKML